MAGETVSAGSAGSETAAARAEAPEVARAGLPPGGKAALPAEMGARVDGFLYQFRVSLNNLQLYPAGSRQASKAATSVYGPLMECLDTLQALTLAEADDVLLANGTPVRSEGSAQSAGRFLLAFLRRVGLKSVTFRMGLSLDEMKAFLQECNRRRAGGQAGEGDSFAAALKEAGVAHIALNERVFVSVSDRDLVIESGAALLERSGDGLDSVMRLVQEVMEITDVQNVEVKDQVRVGLAKQILQENPAIFSQLLGSKPPSGGTSEGGGAVNASILVEAAAEASSLYREMRRRFASGTEEAALADRARALLQRLLTLGEGRVEALAIYRDLLERGGIPDAAPAETPPAVPAPTSPVEEAARLAGRDPLSFLDDSIRETLPRLVRELDLAERYDLAERLLDRLADNLSARTAEVRRKAATEIVDMVQSLEAIARPGLVRALDGRVLEAQEGERDEETYAKLSSILERRAVTLLKEGDFDRMGEILGLVRRHRDVRSRPFERRPILADQAMERLARGDLPAVLLEDLKSGDPARQDRARELFVKMQEMGVKPLIDEVKKSEDLRLRHLLVLVIRSIGEDGVARLVETLSEERSPLVIARLLDVIRSVGMEDLVFESLKGLLRHPVAQIRLEVLDALHKMGGAKAADLALGALADDDPRVRTRAASILGDTRSREGIGPLLALLAPRGLFGREVEENLAEAAIQSLGAIGDERALPSLLELLESAPRLPLRKGRSARLRLAAARALVRFHTDPKVWEALTRSLQDRDPYLRGAVQALLQDEIMKKK